MSISDRAQNYFIRDLLDECVHTVEPILLPRNDFQLGSFCMTDTNH